MRPPFLEAIFRTSSSEVAPPTSISDRDSSVKIAREHSGRSASSGDELYTEIQQPHVAIFKIKCAHIYLV